MEYGVDATHLRETLLDFVVNLVDVGSLLSLQQTLLGDIQRDLQIIQRLLHYTLHLL